MIRVLHLDDDVVVVDKPAGLLTHRSHLARDRDVAMMRARDAIGRYVYPVHRLDRQTSGALLFALHEDATRSLRDAFDTGNVTKSYLAIARGETPREETIDSPVPSDENGERVLAVTRIQTLYSGDYFSLVHAFPQTGRYHQIRRHMAHIRHPLACDSNYGTGWFNRKIREEASLHRLALHAHSISFAHPKGHMLRVCAPLATDFCAALDALNVPRDVWEVFTTPSEQSDEQKGVRAT